jgi:2-polyprenyl-6-hydroxyphenyl methylase/3-demethylubiquinone-9 3-methyltransferase
VSLGQILRRILGPLTDPVARLYRSYYVDLESLGRTLGRLLEVNTIVEIGCGDGHLCEALAHEFESASVLGIDIAEAPGGLYAGRSEGVEFRQVLAEDLINELPGGFDLVVLSDVLHHVPVAERGGLLDTAWALTSDGGHLAVKDWVSTPNLATGLAYLSDRFITGDRPLFFESQKAFIDLVAVHTPGGTIMEEGSVPPHHNNLYLVTTKS